MAIRAPALDFDELNHSELVALAQWAGLPASRAHSREDLIESIKHFDPAYLPETKIEPMRVQLSTWLRRYWSRLRMQAKKKVCPNCHLCRDMQVLECYSKNKRYFGG